MEYMLDVVIYWIWQYMLTGQYILDMAAYAGYAVYAEYTDKEIYAGYVVYAG